MDYSNNSNNLHFAFDQQESEVSDHKATSSTESPSNMSPFSNQFQYNFKMLHVGVTNSFRIICVCQWLATGWWFYSVSSTNNTERHDITEILLKVTLNTITLTLELSDNQNIQVQYIKKTGI